MCSPVRPNSSDFLQWLPLRKLTRAAIRNRRPSIAQAPAALACSCTWIWGLPQPRQVCGACAVLVPEIASGRNCKHASERPIPARLTFFNSFGCSRLIRHCLRLRPATVPIDQNREAAPFEPAPQITQKGLATAHCPVFRPRNHHSTSLMRRLKQEAPPAGKEVGSRDASTEKFAAARLPRPGLWAPHPQVKRPRQHHAAEAPSLLPCGMGRPLEVTARPAGGRGSRPPRARSKVRDGPQGPSPTAESAPQLAGGPTWAALMPPPRPFFSPASR